MKTLNKLKFSSQVLQNFTFFRIGILIEIWKLHFEKETPHN
jgi:hypothetical protein